MTLPRYQIKLIESKANVDENDNNCFEKANGNHLIEDSVYGSILSTSKKKAGESGFEYKTLDGSVIKSVLPPGKGLTLNYKVGAFVVLFICFFLGSVWVIKKKAICTFFALLLEAAKTSILAICSFFYLFCTLNVNAYVLKAYSIFKAPSANLCTYSNFKQLSLFKTKLTHFFISQVNPSLGAPKPYNYPTSSPMSPPMAGPKSPTAYPPPSGWSQPKPVAQQQNYSAPNPAMNYGSNTLPRSAAGQNQGQYNYYG